MMNGQEKSDSGIVAVKSTNKAGQPGAELAEPRPETKGNVGQQSTHRAQDRARVTQALDRVRKAARLRKKERFTALLHHVNVDTLRTAFYALRRKAAPGVDGMRWRDYEADLEPRLRDLHERVHRGAYRPQPSRRTYIPKADGKQRPLAIAALEDKIVQGACVMVLNAIYEGDFCGFSLWGPETWWAGVRGHDGQIGPDAARPGSPQEGPAPFARAIKRAASGRRGRCLWTHRGERLGEPLTAPPRADPGRRPDERRTGHPGRSDATPRGD